MWFAAELLWLRIGVAGGVGCGVGFTTTTRGAESESGGEEGRHTAGRVTYLCGSMISRESEQGLSNPFADPGDRIGSIALFGSMSTMNLPTDGLDFGRLIDMLKLELCEGDRVDDRSDGEVGDARLWSCPGV